MKKLLITSALALMIFIPATQADQPSDKPTNNGKQAVDCSGLVSSPKNLGQLNKFVRTTGFLSGQNVPTDGREAGVPVDEWVHDEVLSLCGIGRDPS